MTSSQGLSFTTFLWALFCAATFVTWPQMAKFAGISGQWSGVMVLAISCVPGIGLTIPALQTQPYPSLRAIAFMTSASLLNGAAVYIYSLKTADHEIPTGTFIVVTTILMVLIGFGLSVLLTNQDVSLRQCFGLCAAVIAIYLLAT